MIKTIAFFSLGCKVNQAENITYIQQCNELNFRIVDFKEKADVYVLNTCAVTKEAERQSYQYIRRALRLNPSALIFVTGCVIKNGQIDNFIYESETEPQIVLIPNSDKNNLIKIIYKYLNETGDTCNLSEDTAFPSPGGSGNTRLNLKITDGCENFCSYCIIPYRRGKVKSIPEDNVINIINKAHLTGYREIILTGINLGAYGKDFGPTDDSRTHLENLLIRMEKETAIHRLRLSSLEILNITDNLIEIIKNSSKICPHLHVPLQSGSNNVLKAMGRRYGAEEFLYRIKKLQNAIPGITVTTDIIVGFPVEEDSDFEETCKIAHEIGFNRIHSFPFSLRPDTRAALLKNSVSGDKIKERMRILNSIGDELNIKWLKTWIGKETEILTENIKNNYSEGLNANYARIRVKIKYPVTSNMLVNVRVENLNEKEKILQGLIIA